MAATTIAGLSQRQIVDASFGQLQEVGLDALSMRGVAGRLGVQAPAIYWHFRNKAELLEAMVLTIYQTAISAVPAGTGWQPWLLAFGRILRQTLLSHRDGARLCVKSKPLGSAPDPMKEASYPLVAAGLAVDVAVARIYLVISLTIGCVSFEQAGEIQEFIADVMDFERAFEAGLTAMVAGFWEPGGAQNNPVCLAEELSAHSTGSEIG